MKPVNNLTKLQEEYQALRDECEEIYDKKCTLEDESYDLSVEIETAHDKIEQSQQKILELQATIEQLIHICEEGPSKLEAINSELQKLEEKYNRLDTLANQKDEQINTIFNKEYCKRALTVNAKNSLRATLNKNTSTTPLITKFCKNKENEFLILDAKMRLPDCNNFSYIIIRTNTTITGARDNVPTMTEIKSVAGKSISSVTIPRMQFLKEHILKAIKRYDKIKTNQIIPLLAPCPIGGQSDTNKEGYGWDWTYGVGIEGTYYGEMTGFDIIGIQINDFDYW